MSPKSSSTPPPQPQPAAEPESGAHAAAHDDAVVAFLRAAGGASLRHAGGHSLLEHLLDTAATVRRWHQPAWLSRAALLHSVYGTDAYSQRLLLPEQRPELATLAGEEAERLGYLFGVIPREQLIGEAASGAPTAREHALTAPERDALVLLHMANAAAQAQAPDGSPGRWLVSVRELAELLIDSATIALPLFIAELARFTPGDEARTREAYRIGVARDDDEAIRANRLALAAATCPVVPEPCVWLAYLARRAGDDAGAQAWAERAWARLEGLGTAWDKRLTFEQWGELIRTLADGGGETGLTSIRDPRALFRALTAKTSQTRHATPPGGDPSPAASRARFQRYVESLADLDGAGAGALYPDLPSQPWYDADAFPLARELEANAEVIRAELLALDAGHFQRESERIKRSGDWDVLFFYERGRRHDAVCTACPVTTQAIESHATVRTLAGLIYLSRMRPATHIRAHHGPTNLRLRCHLGITVPEGDCAIRVGTETRRWRVKQCLVFDDHFEHEAWNQTAEDRLVLIVDLWHPALSSSEVALLEGLHRYAAAQGQRLTRYWAANAAAAAERHTVN